MENVESVHMCRLPRDCEHGGMVAGAAAGLAQWQHSSDRRHAFRAQDRSLTAGLAAPCRRSAAEPPAWARWPPWLSCPFLSRLQAAAHRGPPSPSTEVTLLEAISSLLHVEAPAARGQCRPSVLRPAFPSIGLAWLVNGLAGMQRELCRGAVAWAPRATVLG